MDTGDALGLIGPAIPGEGGTWADLGAGDGTFTRALAERLGPEARIYAVDRDRRALAALERWTAKARARVVPVVADLTGPFALPGMGGGMLDGILLANTLHFVRDSGAVLARLAERVRPGGRVVLVEYDDRPASPWVPHPIPAARLPQLARAAGLSPFTILGRRPSAFGGALYVAAADRLGGA